MFAGVGFYGSQVFYNSYLPEIADEQMRDRVSARGYSFGYIGSVIMQLIGFVLVLMMPDSFLPLKITFLLVGLRPGLAYSKFVLEPLRTSHHHQA